VYSCYLKGRLPSGLASAHEVLPRNGLELGGVLLSLWVSLGGYASVGHMYEPASLYTLVHRNAAGEPLPSGQSMIPSGGFVHMLTLIRRCRAWRIHPPKRSVTDVGSLSKGFAEALSGIS